MANNIALKVSRVTKTFRLFSSHSERLKESLHPLRKKYHRPFEALSNVSFEVKRGETVGIIGRNGSGKSTLLQIICGILQPTAGSASVNGRVSAILELGAGFNPEFTGRENVFVNGAILGLRREEIESRLDGIASFADIGDFFDQPVKTYSSGMVVRLAFAVAVSVEPDILVVDEALAVGDEAFQRKCFSRIQTIREKGGTILFVSHSGSTVVEICDWAMLLDRGELLMVGEPKKVVSTYQKLVYAPWDRVEAIRSEIQSGQVGVKQDNTGEDTSECQKLLAEGLESGRATYDPFLRPKSTMRYESRGALIRDPQIRTLSGQQVNILYRGDRYRYCYSVCFQRSAFNVRFGMLIKTVTGLELGGAMSLPYGESILCVDAGEIADVEFSFSCFLIPGTYFLNAGVQGEVDGTYGYIDRIIDAAMFNVLYEPGFLATGIIDFRISPSVKLRGVS